MGGYVATARFRRLAVACRFRPSVPCRPVPVRPFPFVPLIFLAAHAAAQAVPSETAAFDKLWAKTLLYKTESAGWLREVRLLGREQIDWYQFDDGSHTVTGFYNRRTRIGTDLLFGGGLSFRLELDYVAAAGGLRYNKLTDCYFRQELGPACDLYVGKQSTMFTLDSSISSKQLLTIERSVIAYNIGVPEDSVPGVSLDLHDGPWQSHAAVFSAGAATPGFGEFDAAAFGVLSVGYDFAKGLRGRRALLRTDYMLQGADPQNTTGKPAAFTRDHRQALSVNFQLEDGPWGLNTELAASEGQGRQSDLKGVCVQPSYAFSQAWQGVFRYTRMTSALDNGLRFTRYESAANAGRGDRYDEYYFGINRYFYGHKLKWMFGLQHARMHDAAADGGAYAGWGLSSGFRVYW